MKALMGILILLFWTGVSYIACRETVRFDISGTVVGNSEVTTEDGTDQVVASGVTISQADGSEVRFANENDYLIGKIHADKIQKLCQPGKLVRIRVNGFGNIVSVKRFDKIEPSSTNEVVTATK